MEGAVGMGRPRGKREHSPFEELKDHDMIGAQKTRCGERQRPGGADTGEAGSPDRTGAYKMDLAPLAQARVHC